MPILGFYSTDDRLGGYYKNFTKKLVEETITAPKKAVDAGSRDMVRSEISIWPSSRAALSILTSSLTARLEKGIQTDSLLTNSPQS